MHSMSHAEGCRRGCGGWIWALGLMLAAGTAAPQASAQGKGEMPFKEARINFETNASACDMGIQIVFDTEGIRSGKVYDPNGRVIHEIRARAGIADIGGQTEGFLEVVEPVVIELAADADAACDPDPEDLAEAITLEDLNEWFPAGFYEFEGRGVDGEIYDDEAELTYDVPAGPALGAPDGDSGIDSTLPLDITWAPVTLTIPGLLPGGAQNPVDVVAYQVLVSAADGGDAPVGFDVIVAGDQTSVTVPPQLLEPDTEYEIEVLAIEVSGNQTITEGLFETAP